MQEVPGASEVVGEEEEEESPRPSHCQVHQTAQHATSLGEGGREGRREWVSSTKPFMWNSGEGSLCRRGGGGGRGAWLGRERGMQPQPLPELTEPLSLEQEDEK